MACRIGLILFLSLVYGNLLSAQEPDWAWIKSWQAGATEVANGMVVDPNSENFYIVGSLSSTSGALFPAGSTLSSDFSVTYGGQDGYIAKLGPDGALIWAFRVGGANEDGINSVELDSAGNIFVTGMSRSNTVQFAGTTPPDATSSISSTGAVKVFMAKYNPGGALQWAHVGASTVFAWGNAICSKNSGIYLTGTYKYGFDLGGLHLADTTGLETIFLAKFSHSGTIQWIKTLKSDRDVYSTGISCDNNQVYLTGYLDGNHLILMDSQGVQKDTVSTGTLGNNDIFIFCATGEGSPLWTRRMGSSGDDISATLVVDSDLIYLTGNYGAPAIFPDYSYNPVAHTGGTDAFIGAFSKTDGSTIWVSTLGDDEGNNQEARDIEIDPARRLYVTGYYTGKITGGSYTDFSLGNEDIFLASLTSMGSFNWIKSLGGSRRDIGTGVSASNPGTVYLAGNILNSIVDSILIIPSAGTNENILAAKIQDTCSFPLGGNLQASQPAICGSGPVQLVLRDYRGTLEWQVSPPDAHTWSKLTDETTDTISFVADSTADYRVLVSTDSCGSTVSNIVRINVESAPVISLPADTQVCGLETVLVAVTDGIDGSWSAVNGPGTMQFDNGVLFDQVSIDVDAYGTYTVQFTALGQACTSTAQADVTFNEIPTVDAGGEVQVCLGDGVRLHVEAQGSYLWSPGQLLDDSTLQDPVAMVDSSTAFTVSVTAANGCVGTDDVLVNVFQPVSADAGPDQVLIEATETRMSALLVTGETGLWSLEQGSGTMDNPQDPNTMVTQLAGGENIFGWHVSNGVCPESVDLVYISVIEAVIPTVITPNGDGLNDYFIINGIEYYEHSALVVLNRWGEEVYREEPYTNRWSGQDRSGRSLPEGTYYIVLKITENDIRKGYVVLVR